MTLLAKRLILVMSIAAIAAAADHPRFDPPTPESLPNHQSISGVIAAASAFETDEQARPAFGKVNPYKYGALPVLVVIRNDSKTAISLDRMRAEYIGPDRQKIVDTPANQVRYLTGVQTSSSAGGMKIKQPKGGLTEWEIEGRAFAARILPPGASASGFFYFQTGHRSGSNLILTGLRKAQSGEELLYFELSLERVR